MKPPTLLDRLWAAFLRFDERHDGLGGLLIFVFLCAFILLLMSL